MSENSNNATTQTYIQPDDVSYTADIDNIWLLPDGVSDLFSEEAEKQEWLRYNLTQKLINRGYQLVSPPMIEFTESLLGNASEDLKRQTFKIIDQLSGRLMGVRADITPQILRIDTHLTKLNATTSGKVTPISRYCYAGHVIRTLPDGLFGSRTPLQLGAEIFGSDSLDADLELTDVLFCLLDGLDVKQHLHIDVGHVAIFTRLKTLAELSTQQATALIKLYANKALPELQEVCANLPMGDDFYHLAVYGHNVDALAQKLSATAKNDICIINAIHDVKVIVSHIKNIHKANVSVDITELGFHYHTGIVFNAYFDNESQAVIRGGRFNGKQSGVTDSESINSKNNTANSEFLSTREATGFSLDVSRLQRYITLDRAHMIVIDFADLQATKQQASQPLIESLAVTVQQLRDANHQVIYPLNEQDMPANITHKLVLNDKDWVLEPFKAT